MIAAAIVLIDTVVFYVPLTSLLIAYVIVFQPPWFLRWVAKLYRIRKEDRDSAEE